MEKIVLAGKIYVVSAPEECTITQKRNEQEFTLAKIPAAGGQKPVTTIDTVLKLSSDNAIISGPFEYTPALDGYSDGGNIESDLNVGHAAADAVAAVCTLTLGDLATGGTLTDSNDQSVELENPHKYAEGWVAMPDATAAGTIAFGEHEAIEFEAKAAANASCYWDNETGSYGLPPIQLRRLADPENPAGEYEVLWESLEAYGTDEEFVAAFNSEQDAAEAEISELEYNPFLITAKGDYAGAEGNRLVIANNYEGYTRQLSGGVDARTPQEVVDTLNDSEDCPAVAVLSHVEEQDAKAVFTPLESYVSGLDYQLSIMENDAVVNSWSWQAQEGDGVQELVAALNDDTGQLWYNTRDIEATLEDGKVVLRKLESHGAASNGYSVNLDVNPPFEESEETPIEGGLDESYTISFTAKEYGVNDTIVVTGSLFSDEDGMSGGHGDYTVAELVSAISGEFSDITPAAGEAEGTITLTATTAGKAANAITYTATGCFGSGATRQGSTTRGKDAVEQTAFKIYLNGEEFTGGSITVDPAPTQGSENAVSSGGVYTALRALPAPVPEPLGTTTTLLHGHVYTLAVAENTDLSALGVELYGTAELWIDYTAGSVDWTGIWWAEGSAPTLAAGKSYAIALRNDGVKLRANVQYEDDTPAQS